MWSLLRKNTTKPLNYTDYIYFKPFLSEAGELLNISEPSFEVIFPTIACK